MGRDARAFSTGVQSLSLDQLYRSSRRIVVRVLDGAREVDSFQVSSPEMLRAALRPIHRHMPRRGGLIQFTGVEERWLPLGVKRIHREIALGSLDSALAFLAG